MDAGHACTRKVQARHEQDTRRVGPSGGRRGGRGEARRGDQKYCDWRPWMSAYAHRQADGPVAVLLFHRLEEVLPRLRPRLLLPAPACMPARARRTSTVRH